MEEAEGNDHAAPSGDLVVKLIQLVVNNELEVRVGCFSSIILTELCQKVNGILGSWLKDELISRPVQGHLLVLLRILPSRLVKILILQLHWVLSNLLPAEKVFICNQSSIFRNHHVLFAIDLQG